MTLVEFFGFIISMLALIYLLGRRAKTERAQKPPLSPEMKQAIEEQREQLRKLGLLFEEEEELEEEPPPPPVQHAPPPIKKQHIPERLGHQFDSKITSRELHTRIESRKYETHITDEEIDIAQDPIVSSDMTFDDQQAYLIRQAQTGSSRLKVTLEKLPSLSQVILFREVLGKPHAFRFLDAHEFPYRD